MNDQQIKKDSSGKGFRKHDRLYIAVAAGEGGLPALRDFFAEITALKDAIYLVSLNLDEYPDTLEQELHIASEMDAVLVDHTLKLEENHIYIIPPSHSAEIQHGSITPFPMPPSDDTHHAIDRLFKTLSENKEADVIAVVLSGAGDAGTKGIPPVKASGGVIFVQNPRESVVNEMPRNAIATGEVDEVLSAKNIPAIIRSLAVTKPGIDLWVEVEKRPTESLILMNEIFNDIRLKTGHDFSEYKRPTLLRRLERRIEANQCGDLRTYTSFIKKNPEEVNALVKDLLISVTSFFRDKEAFDYLDQEVLSQLLKTKGPHDQLRIWVPGCATGEEAYTLAILCAERLSDQKDAPKIQIFATDIDSSAIATSREGLYTAYDLANVSPVRLRRFFNKEEDNYRIRREIRESILFANHNFLKDPPFSNLDLISCRNVLIYFNNVAKDQVFNTFHFSLKPGGFLFLGLSESVDATAGLFATYNREQHVFQSKRVSGRAYPFRDAGARNKFDPSQFFQITKEKERKEMERLSFGDLHLQLLEQYAPPSLVVNEEYDVMHISEKAGSYLQIGGGDISKNILKLIRPEFRLELRTALYQAAQSKSVVEAPGIKCKIGERSKSVNIKVRPIFGFGGSPGFFLVLFESQVSEVQEIVKTSADAVTRHLEEELTHLKAHLRVSNEQHEFQAEELKASNEELQAMNEELRSVAEELETRKEELQSINEELRTVNQELKIKVQETSLFANNLQNLINSTDIGTVFLDRSLKVAFFTPAVRQIFNLIATDYGRPITDITNRLHYNELVQDAETVLEKLSIIEKEVSSVDEQVYLMHMFPYRTTDDRINGVVLTFVDITTRIRNEEALKETVTELMRFNKAMISRETRMIELKKEVNELHQRLGEPPPYRVSFENEDATDHE